MNNYVETVNLQTWVTHKLINNQLLKTKSAAQHEEKCLLKRAKRNLKDTETRYKNLFCIRKKDFLSAPPLTAKN